ncbi:KAP family P-loop NTPase fold protein [Alkanindiges illinoisensis]|uniref:KAP family P-loop NTPase fold protein n=1 Tax=Alkanindiges illinoisensis TaxID=197183 RepID=UPI0006863EF7|nr:P-loop NTPase fold protein [Alkanindiges illinoisensis]
MTVNRRVNLPKVDFSNIEVPFEGDLWKREALSNQLTNYVGRLEAGATLAIDAEWGAGKTWFVHHWKKVLTHRGHQVIYLDAFSNDYLEDPFIIIATEIAERFEKEKAGLGVKLREKAVAAYHALLPNLPMLLFHLTMSLIGAGAISKGASDIIKDVKDNSGEVGEKFAEAINEQIKEHLEERVKNHEAEKRTLDSFKHQLQELSKELDKPLIFIIDELDRCKPEFSIRLIERIKHFFDTPKIVFVLAMHKAQLCESINSYYGFQSKNYYLDKFIDFTVLLSTEEQKKQISYEAITEQYLVELGLYPPSDAKQSGLFREACWLCATFHPSARQIKKIFNKYSLLLSPDNETKKSMLFLTLFLDEIGFIPDKEGATFELIYDRLQPLYIKKYGTSYHPGPTGTKEYITSFQEFINNILTTSYGQMMFQYLRINKKFSGASWQDIYEGKAISPPIQGHTTNFDNAWFDYIHQGF